jgi:hypothetical protein
MERNGARPILSPMNISWSDLNNVQDAGDYPFRDGTISVTFAEVAIWKKNPDAQFRLMRKHPIQSAFKYVLGRQIEENLAADDTELIYESSNGDSWCLTRDSATGAQAVMHRPNPQSGGQVSYIEIEKFLSEGANGAEHQALRRLMEKLPSAVDRIDPARVLGSHHYLQRGTPAPDSEIIRRLLQLRQNASVFAQGCADFPSDSSDRNHSFTPDPRRASPSLRPGLSFSVHTRSLRAMAQKATPSRGQTMRDGRSPKDQTDDPRSP